MRLILIGLMLCVSVSASAMEVKIYSDHFVFNEKIVDPQLKINAELGRAWVQLGVLKGINSDRRRWTELKRAKVEGLYFDQESEEIVFNSTQTGKVTCATSELRRRRFSNRMVRFINPTNRCQFEVREEIELIDDGFDIKRVKLTNLYLITK